MSPEERAQQERFESLYARSQLPVMLTIERSVCGCAYGGNSWTTRAEAERIAACLDLRPGLRLLDLGAGAGWPGLYMSETSGCDAVLADLPLAGMQIAAERARRDCVAGKISAVVANAAALPFADGSFDAISHSDLLCCLVEKRAVLAACRRAIRPQGRMAFTVISVVPGLSGAPYRRAVDNGPPFVESDGAYAALLAETGWSVTHCEDITVAYAASCRRQLDADEAQKSELLPVIGADEFAERVESWRSKIAALGDGLLRRELFTAVPILD